jgi:phosphatidylglycerophosphate synthase
MSKLKKHDENFIDNILIDLCEYISKDIHSIGLTPNIITTISLLFGLFTSVFLCKKMYYIACIFWIIAYFLDCLDGYIARKYKETSKFGDYYDHISDMIKLTVVLFMLFKINSVKFNHIIIVLGIFGFLMMIHLGCQEKQYSKNDSESLSLTKLIPTNIFFKNNSSAIQFTKYFGCGTFNLVVVLCFIYYSYGNKF